MPNDLHTTHPDCTEDRIEMEPWGAGDSNCHAAVGIVSNLPLPGDKLLDSIFGVISHVVRARRAALMLFDENHRLVVCKSHGISEDFPGQPRIDIVDPLLGSARLAPQPKLVHAIESQPLGLGQARLPTQSLISVPIFSDGKLYGVLNTADKLDDEPFDQYDLTTLTLLGQHIALCIENAILHRHIAHLANTDDLTGLNNHRYFEQRLDEEMERAKRFGRGLALLMADLDSFKEFNDQHGHLAGDVVLQQVAKVLQSAVRQSDVASRYGGDEFAIIAPETDIASARTLASRLVESIASHDFHVSSSLSHVALKITVGITDFGDMTVSKRELISEADKALYRAKGSGQAVCCWN